MGASFISLMVLLYLCILHKFIVEKKKKVFPSKASQTERDVADFRKSVELKPRHLRL